MCLPRKCLQRSLECFSFIILILGIATIGAGIYNLSTGESEKFWKQANISWGNAISGLLLGLGVITLLGGTFGLIGSCKRSKTCLCFYQIIVFILLLLFGIMAIIGLAMTSSYVGKMQDDLSRSSKCSYATTIAGKCPCGNDLSGETPNSLTWIQAVNNATANVQTFFGQEHTPAQTEDCKIYLANNLKTQLGTKLPNNAQTSNLPHTALDCDFMKTNQNLNGYGVFMQFLEQTFQCSGVCYEIPYYVFSDVNKTPVGTGIPHGSCYEQIIDFFTTYGKVVYAVAFSVFAFLLLNILLTCCFCCQKKQSEGGVYQRMDYLQD